ncbi:MAG TPA: response regulator [Microvirga sp.]|jgi:CheY-like chemotaxis protein|nr:response regulator [Microvirga sp.]
MPELKPILLVEDNPKDVELTLAALEDARVANEVVVARDGAEALDYLFGRGSHEGKNTRDPALVILDLKMPKIDGMEVLKAVKENPTLAQVPVVMLTGSKEERDVLQGYNLGANSYVIKPFGTEEFMSAIRHLGIFWAILNEPPPA